MIRIPSSRSASTLGDDAYPSWQSAHGCAPGFYLNSDSTCKLKPPMPVCGDGYHRSPSYPFDCVLDIDLGGTPCIDLNGNQGTRNVNGDCVTAPMPMGGNCVDEYGNSGKWNVYGQCVVDVDNTDIPCTDDNGMASHYNKAGTECVMAKCDPGMSTCGGWCVGCGPNATINLGDCGCDCLPGYVYDPALSEHGCVRSYNDSPAFGEGGAPAARPPSGIAPPIDQSPHLPPVGDQAAVADNTNRNLAIAAGVGVLALVGYLATRKIR